VRRGTIITLGLLGVVASFAGCALDRNGLLRPAVDGLDGGVRADARADSSRLRDARMDTGADAGPADAGPPDALVDAPVSTMTDAGPDGGAFCADCASWPDYSRCGADEQCFNGTVYSSCGAGGRCFGGRCVTACATHDNGTETCDTLCAWCTGRCVFTWSDRGTGESCSVTGTPAWCYCDWS